MLHPSPLRSPFACFGGVHRAGTLLVALTPLTALATPPQYHVTHLSPELAYGIAWAIDEGGNIAGEVQMGCGARWMKSGVDWEFSVAAPGCDFPGFVVPRAISGNTIVGGATSGAFQSHAFVIDDASLALLPAGAFAWASDVNAAGQIVGTIGWNTGFLFDDGVLSLLPEGSTAETITNDGVVLGSAAGHATFWNRVEGVWVPAPLGIRAASSVARAINVAGHVAGEFRAEPGGPQHPFLWHDGEMIDLGTLGGTHASVAGITDAGAVVGWSDVLGGTSHPFLWQDGVMHDLNTLLDASPFELIHAFGCNAQGQIVGSALLPGGASLPYVATPIIAGDLTLDARVDGADLGALLSAWGRCGTCPESPCAGDLDGNCFVDGADLGMLLGAWTG